MQQLDFYVFLYGKALTTHSGSAIVIAIISMFSFSLDHDWQSGKSLGECNMEMLNTKLLADVTCYIGKKRVPFRVHKYVLVSRSAAFFTMFCMRSPPVNEIDIPDVEPEVFDSFLRYGSII